MLAFREHQRKLKNEGLFLWTGRENKSTDSQLNNTVNEVGIWSKRIFGIHEKYKVSVLYIKYKVSLIHFFQVFLKLSDLKKN